MTCLRLFLCSFLLCSLDYSLQLRLNCSLDYLTKKVVSLCFKLNLNCIIITYHELFCFQEGSKHPLRPLREESAKTFASRMLKFSEIPGEVKQDLRDRLLSVDTEAFLLPTLSRFQFHKGCYDGLNDR